MGKEIYLFPGAPPKSDLIAFTDKEITTNRGIYSGITIKERHWTGKFLHHLRFLFDNFSPNVSKFIFTFRWPLICLKFQASNSSKLYKTAKLVLKYSILNRNKYFDNYKMILIKIYPFSLEIQKHDILHRVKDGLNPKFSTFVTGTRSEFLHCVKVWWGPWEQFLLDIHCRAEESVHIARQPGSSAYWKVLENINKEL